MPVTFPITLPSSPAPERVVWSANATDGITTSPFTGLVQIQKLSNRSWSAQVDYPAMTLAQSQEWFAALLSLDGVGGRFLFGDPGHTAKRGTWAGTPVVDGIGQTGKTLALSGFSAGATVKAGDYFQISTGEFARLHQAVLDATADGSGRLTLDIWPAHRSSPGSGDPITSNNPKGVFRLTSGNVARSAQELSYGFSLDIIEAIQ